MPLGLDDPVNEVRFSEVGVVYHDESGLGTWTVSGSVLTIVQGSRTYVVLWSIARVTWC